jgi:hypothetical protein
MTDMKQNVQCGSRFPWSWVLAFACGFIFLLGLLLRREETSKGNDATEHLAGSALLNDGHNSSDDPRGQRRFRSAPGLTAEENVASRVVEFGRTRLFIAEAMARKTGVEVPEQVWQFFGAVEAGNWPEIQSFFQALLDRRKAEPRSPELDAVWPAVFEAYGVAEITQRDWPAQKLLDYGNAVLGSLRPGMIYIGGTDPGRWIPTLLNETSGGERHVIVTQNALADRSYLDYLTFLYGDRVASLTKEDSDRAFQDYVNDAQKRLLHDQQFPDEPKQIRPGEDVRINDGRVRVGGQVAVMSINERLLQAFMEKNPEASFALEESFPLKSTYAQASPLGPIMELGVKEQDAGLTAERAEQSLNYWRGTAQQLVSDPESVGSPEALKSFSKLVVSHGNLFADHGYSAEAEEAYRIAVNMCPFSPEAAGNLCGLLWRNGRTDEAVQFANEFIRNNPDQQRAMESIIKDLTGATWRM